MYFFGYIWSLPPRIIHLKLYFKLYNCSKSSCLAMELHLQLSLPSASRGASVSFLSWWKCYCHQLYVVFASSCPVSISRAWSHGSCFLHGRAAGSGVQGTLSSLDCTGPCKLSQWLWQWRGDAAWQSAEPGSDLLGFQRPFKPPSLRGPVVKYPLFIVQTPIYGCMVSSWSPGGRRHQFISELHNYECCCKDFVFQKYGTKMQAIINLFKTCLRTRKKISATVMQMSTFFPFLSHSRLSQRVWN